VRLTPAGDRIAHAVEGASVLLALLPAAELSLQFFDPRIGALERLVLDESRLHQRVDRMRRPFQSISE
jgi:hypothetical protein